MCNAYKGTYDSRPIVLKTPRDDTGYYESAANDLEVELLMLREFHHENIVLLEGAGMLPNGLRFVLLVSEWDGHMQSLVLPDAPHIVGCVSRACRNSLAAGRFHPWCVEVRRSACRSPESTMSLLALQRP